MIGYVIGNYKITQKLGEGGMGEVFKGIDLMLEREVAIKMLRPELARQQAIVERFRAEAVTLAKLNHANIATLYNFVRQGNDLFMVMEYVKGSTFETIIKKSGALPFQRALQLFAQALEGIAHAHRLGIIHRDLKPANVMLKESGLIKVMDFGIARALGSNRLTRTGNVIGTMEYMSPEQIRGEDTDARSDIYSAGILLYEMLTGRVPFESTSEYELMRRQVEDAPLPPRSFSKQIPLQVERAIMRSLAKKPSARFQTADEFRAVLLKCIEEATSRLANPSAIVQPPPVQAHTSMPQVAGHTAFEAGRAASKKVPDTLDFTSEPPQAVKETRLPEAPQAILKETRLANDAPSDSQAALKETRFASHQERQSISFGNQQAAVSQQFYQEPSFNPQEAPPQRVAVAAFIKRLNWKHYATALLLALLSIPIAFLASSNHPSQTNANQALPKKQLAAAPEPNREATAPMPAASHGARPAPVEPKPHVEPQIPVPAAETVSQEKPSESGRGGRKARRVGSRQPAPAKETARPQEGNQSEKKEEKKKEKKGGLFDKVKGGLKKINPFKKD
jgi:serine/threonine protein kinase